MAQATPNILGRSISASTELLARFEKTPMIKVFGLLVRSTNVLLKFRLILNTDSSSLVFNLVYLNEEPINFRITFMKKFPSREVFPPQMRKNMSLFQGKFSQTFNESDLKTLRFKIEVSLISVLPQDYSFMAKLQNSFNDEDTSDCVIQCRGVNFYTHQFILKQRSPHFLDILSKIGEKKGTITLEFNDFEPKIVEVMLRYLYNDGICPRNLLGNSQDLIHLMKLAEKHFLEDLLDTCDSAYAQFCIFNSEINPQKTFNYFVRAIEATSAPKSAAVFWKWKSGEDREITDDQWIKAVNSNQNLAAIFAKVGNLRDFKRWVIQQEEKMLLPLSIVNETGEFSSTNCDFSFIVGKFGRMKGEVQCPSISFMTDSELEDAEDD